MRKTVIIIALALFPVSLLAQNDDVYNESVVVKGSYTPVIEQSEKLNFPAQITDTLTRIDHAFHYGITPTRLRAVYEPTRIRAARIIGEPSTKLYNNYLRLGLGNYWSPLADLYWSSTRDRLKTYGVRINHFSSWAGLSKLPEYGNTQFGNTGVTLFGKYILSDVLQLHSDLCYEHDHNLYYGFTDNTLQNVLGLTHDNISLADYRASYNVATWNIGVKNMELDANKLGYAANVRLSDLWGVYGQNEMNVNLSGDVHYGFNIMNQYKGIAYLHAEWDYYKNQLPDTRPLGYVVAPMPMIGTNGGILKINPYVDFLFRGLQFRTGLLAGWDGYAINSTSPVFHLFPDITVSKKFMNDNLVLSLAATGGMDAVSLNVVRQINPYIVPDYTPMATNHYDFVFHTRWSLNRKLEANAEVRYSLLEGDPVFSLDPAYSLNNVYRIYGLSDNRFTVGGDITFVNDEMITLRAGGHYYNYAYTGIGVYGNQMVNYYRPNWDALVSVDLNYNYKWFFHLESVLLGKMQGDSSQELPMRYGINAQVEYRHNRALSFFLQMDNLAFQRYWYWANYPSQRGLFIGGLTYTIPHK